MTDLTHDRLKLAEVLLDEHDGDHPSAGSPPLDIETLARARYAVIVKGDRDSWVLAAHSAQDVADIALRTYTATNGYDERIEEVIDLDDPERDVALKDAVVVAVVLDGECVTARTGGPTFDQEVYVADQSDGPMVFADADQCEAYAELHDLAFWNAGQTIIDREAGAKLLDDERADSYPKSAELVHFAWEDGAPVESVDDAIEPLDGDLAAALLLAQETPWRWLTYAEADVIPGRWEIRAWREQADAWNHAYEDGPKPGDENVGTPSSFLSFAFDGRNPPRFIDGPGGVGFRLANDKKSAALAS